MPRRKLIFEWEDGSGGSSQPVYQCLADGVAELTGPELDLVAAMHLASGARLKGVWECRWLPIDEIPEDTPYGRVEDRVVFSGSTVNRRGVRVMIPSPIAEIFGEDTITANMEHPAVVAIIDAAKLAIANAAGLPPVAFARGKRVEVSFNAVEED